MGKYPIVIEGDKFMIFESDMVIGKEYKFKYLGVGMVAIRTKGCIDLYQVDKNINSQSGSRR